MIHRKPRRIRKRKIAKNVLKATFKKPTPKVI